MEPATCKEAIQNRYIPLDVESVRKRKHRYVDPEEEARVAYWKQFKVALTGSFPAAVVGIEAFSTSQKGQESFCVAIAGSTRVEFNHISAPSGAEKLRRRRRREVASSKAYSKFKNFVRCVSVRTDGKLAASGDDSGVVHVFNIQSRTELRRLFGHTGAVRCCKFSMSGVQYLLTGGNDASLRLWDISDGSCCAHVPDAHGDSVQCLVACASPRNDVIAFASGGYDGLVKLWSFNVDEKGPLSCTACCLHGAPVEALALFPTNGGALLVSGGGSEIKVWDMSGGGSLVHAIRSHVKAVTAVAVSADSRYIVSGSLDHTIKFHCASTTTLLHSITCNDAVTALVTYREESGAELVLAGLNNGEWVMRQRLSVSPNAGTRAPEIPPRPLRPGTAEFFKRGRSAEAPDQAVVVDSASGRRSTPLDRFVQGFHHQRALDWAVRRNSAAPGVALLEALIEQGALHVSVRGKNEKSILPLLAFAHREYGRDIIANPILLEFMNVVLEENSWLYATTDEAVLQALQRLSSKVELDVSQHQILRELMGIIELIDAGSGISTESRL